MAGTGQVLQSASRLPNVAYPVLIPNKRGLDDFLAYLPRLSNEIAIFTAATDAFTKANLNTTIADSLASLAVVTRKAMDHGLKVRGYVSVVIACPYSGPVDYKTVRDVAKALIEMGCYQVSLGDTVGRGTPREIAEMLDEVKTRVPVEQLAGHVQCFHSLRERAQAETLFLFLVP